MKAFLSVLLFPGLLISISPPEAPLASLVNIFPKCFHIFVYMHIYAYTFTQL